MDQIKRINKNEKILNKSIDIINNLEQDLHTFKNIQKQIKELSDYYGSNEWYQDIDDYDNNRLSKKINAGILSEDGIYNMLEDNKEIAIEMLEIATNILKNN